MKKTKHKQLEFDYVKHLKPAKPHDKKTIRAYRKQKLRMREDDTRDEQLNFPFYNE